MNYFDFLQFLTNLIKFVASGIKFVTKLIPEATKLIKFVENTQNSKNFNSIEKAAGNQLFSIFFKKS